MPTQQSDTGATDNLTHCSQHISSLLARSSASQPLADPSSGLSHFHGPIHFSASPPAKGACSPPSANTGQDQEEELSFPYSCPQELGPARASPFSLKRLNCLGRLGAPLSTGRAAWAGPGWAIIPHYLTPLLLKRSSDCSPPSALPCPLLSFTLNYLTHYPTACRGRTTTGA